MSEEIKKEEELQVAENVVVPKTEDEIFEDMVWERIGNAECYIDEVGYVIDCESGEIVCFLRVVRPQSK